MSSSQAKGNGSRGGSGGGGGGEVVGDYAGDDYIPPEAMEGYGPPTTQNATPATNAAPAPVAPAAPAPSSTRTATALTSAAVDDEFTYTGNSDGEDVGFDDGEEGFGYDDDEMFDDAVTEQPQPPAQSFSASRATTTQIPPRAPPSAPVVAAAPAPAMNPSVVACPHCTFENPAGSMDCDVCGLPLAG